MSHVIRTKAGPNRSARMDGVNRWIRTILIARKEYEIHLRFLLAVDSFQEN